MISVQSILVYIGESGSMLCNRELEYKYENKANKVQRGRLATLSTPSGSALAWKLRNVVSTYNTSTIPDSGGLSFQTSVDVVIISIVKLIISTYSFVV